MTDKIKTIWERYAVQIISVLVLLIGFYFTTNAKLQMIDNHESRLKTVEIQIATNNAILERLESKVSDINMKLDKLIDKK